ncbi:MAG TPA: hypothetical protein VMT97_09630 [Terriglobales bacterium]|nr:hypothetical protein [Terriglobales bacterium]
MKKLILLVLISAVLAMPVLAHAEGTRVHGRAHGSHAQGRFIVQGPFYWHPFFYPGPFSYGYPGGLNYAYPGPFVSSGGGESYTYGYPGPFSYGTWEYSRPHCFAKPDGYWFCS